ncbi:Long-chain-fatty-acid--CoA ligase FadD15 [Emticicia aquatica]|uniref:Long-chain-fatty-acid--CoA ligase FadD15 n=1 Tax=Emticicia aquatica TaxID=1681835 RepID=A0ABM9API7_9BACT|nr:AMP-binding protein [Emticicia aquatica]CAH0995805.1 Long-chain-fatty-acid--CoA ligase FadD15 [Emticicia aquatica]
MNISPDKTLLDYFYHWEATTPDNIYLRQPFGDTFKDFTWKETGQQARSLATYLLSLNLPPKSNVGLVSKNCAEWLIADFAIMMAGHVSVPFYATLTHTQINQVLTHSGCEVLFVGKLDDWAGMKSGIPENVKCISFPTYNPDAAHVQWNDILKNYAPLKTNYLPDLEDVFTIIYTSGTTGNPKGVMLKYSAMSNGIYQTRDIAQLNYPNSRFFSYLPLCHIAERNIIEAAAVTIGGTIYFAETLESFAKNLADAKPTHFLAVPRIWTKFQLGILAKMPEKKLNTLLKIPIVSSLVKKKIRQGLGLDKAIVILTGAAPMPNSLIVWFRKLGIVIQEAYGMTENLGAVCMMPKNNIKDGTVGKLYPGMEVKISPENGEILTRSKWNMVGYYKEPTLTAETIDADNWIHTGDVGELDTENYLKITGRVKEMYKTSKGEYVAPAQIEFGFADNNFIEQICVAGGNLPQPIALIVLSDLGKATDKQVVRESLETTLKTLNPHLKSYERVQRLIVLREPWTVENNKMTPTLKIKRNVIEKEFATKLEGWYEKSEIVVWE